VRSNPVDDAARRGRRQLDAVLDDLRSARRAAGLSQASLAVALGCSRPEVSVRERGARGDIGVIQLVRMAAGVGLDISIRAYPAGSPLRDVGQLRVLARFRPAAGPLWHWQTEVPVSRDPSDRRAFDAVLSRGPLRLGVEAITRLTDAQAQVRAITLKQEAAGLTCLVLVLADTHHNRRAVHEGAPTLQPAFPLASRDLLRLLRSGELPPANGIVLV
jgi:transcriptional regulator with XRE-family HTH domain